MTSKYEEIEGIDRINIKFKPLPDQDYLNSIFEYKNGDLYWKRNGGASSIGKKAGGFVNGYMRVKVDGISYVYHRIIWKMMHGYDPVCLDHIDGSTKNNRIENIREVSRRDNNKNTSRRSDNTSGITGVSWHKGIKKWTAHISTKEGSRHLGSFVDKDDAIKARKEAEEKHGYHENHGRENPQKLLEFLGGEDEA